MTDKNGTILKIGDKIINKSGLKGELLNFNGVTKIVVRNFNGEIKQTIPARDLNLEQFEKVEVYE